MTSIKLTASNDNIDIPNFAKIYGILVTAGADAASVKLFDGLTQASPGKEIAFVKAALETSEYVPFSPCLAITAGGASVTITGTSPSIFIYYE